MDNLNDWFYIILLALAAISGLLTSGKKKKQAETFPDESANSDSVPLPQADKAKVKKKKIAQTQTQSDYFSAAAREGRRATPAFVPEAAYTEALDSPEDSCSPLSADALQDMDEIRKAVIYSEIFNRKY
jgi:hypothetical protein